MIKGVTVTLVSKVQTGTDSIGNAVYSETREQIDNVLIGQPSTQEILDMNQLYGRKLSYVLAIPKGDTHEWANQKVVFFDQTFNVIGEPTQGIEAMIPLAWNKKVMVERVDG